MEYEIMLNEISANQQLQLEKLTDMTKLCILFLGLSLGIFIIYFFVRVVFK